MNTSQILCLALDGLSASDSIWIMRQLRNRCYAVKIHSLIDYEGYTVIQRLRNYCRRIWVDFDIHTTPEAASERVAALCSHEVDIITVQASGGTSMMREAVKAACGQQAEIWATTILTSLGYEKIGTIYGWERTRKQIVQVLAHLAKEAGVTGLVCSAQEVSMLRQDPYLDGLKIIVPGTRSIGVALGQQERSGTPSQAMADGATHLVIGSQVTRSKDPLEAFNALEAEIKS